MRLALQALFAAIEANEEGAARRALLERRLRASERSVCFFRRLRGVVDDESLRAPEVFAEESFPDANVVAEYLDAQTEPELSRAYEDACFDSPEILAEVGRCYDILNNDAQNCVVVPKNCRRRLYHIAWEEDNVVNIAQGGGDAPILTNVAPAESKKEDEGKTSETSQTEKSSKEKSSTRGVSRSKRVKEKKVKPAKSVGAALAAERSWGRRAKRWCVRLTACCGILAAGYYGWQTLSDSDSSETLQINVSAPEIALTNGAVERKSDEETPLRPTTISSSSLGEVLTSPSSEIAQTTESATFDEVARPLNAELEAPKLAFLPNAPTIGEGDLDASSANKTRTRVGLGGEEHWNRRPSIEIPARNNDVFTKSKLY